MEKLPTHKIFEFHSDTLEYVRKEHNLDKPGQMDAAIDLLDDWVKKQAHFVKKDLPREYLERTIILDKGSVERAKQQLDKLFTMKTLYPNFFERSDAKNDFEDVHDYYPHALLPKLTKEHYRVYVGKLIKDGITSHRISLAFGWGALLFEHIRAMDYCTGYVGIIDYRDINVVDFIAQINILEMHQFITFITEGYQMRVKALHLLTSSKAIEVLVRLMKQMFPKKISERIRVHMTVESLHECFPKELLPMELGGELKSIVEYHKDWIEVLGTKENIENFKKMNEFKINEKLRDGFTKGDEILGISGSFRTLNVD